MKNIDIEELKKIQTDIMQSVHDFCVSNGLKYSLAYGTLIGAIRHKGFIPWDDDIDIVMPREDYNKFLNSYKHEFYKAYSHKTDPEYAMTFAKVADTRTLLIENASAKPIGINIDIFPIDSFFDTKEEYIEFSKKTNRINQLIFFKLIKPSKKNAWWKRPIILALKALLLPIPMRKLTEKLNKLIETKPQKPDAKFCGQFLSFFRGEFKNVYANNLFDNLILAPFEDRKFYITAEYDSMLRAIFGNYMLPPPQKSTEQPAYTCKNLLALNQHIYSKHNYKFAC